MSEWTVKRPDNEQTPGARAGSYAFGVVVLAALAALAGAFLPMVLATTGVRKKNETYMQRQRRRDRQDAAMETVVHDTKGAMGGRALLGALIGAAVGGVLVFKTETARKKKL